MELDQGSNSSVNRTEIGKQANFMDLTAQNSSWRKRSWTELQQVVKDNSNLNTSLSTRAPSHVAFKHTPNGKLRLYFLGAPIRDTTLMYADVNGDGNKLEWKHLISNASDSSYASMTKEEQLRMERQRTMTLGMTSYINHSPSGTFSFTESSKLYVLNDDFNFNEESRSVRLVETVTTGAKIDSEFCPHNQHLISYVQNGDMWVYDLLYNTEHRLSYSASNGVSSLITAGSPSFIIQEEFDRYTGYWWQPNTNDGIYRILYEEVDNSPVDELRVISPNHDALPDSYRYPRSGTNNATSTLRIAEFTTGSQGKCVTRSLKSSLLSQFNWMEYLVRVCWHPSGKFVCAQILNRSQTHLSIILIPIEQFIYQEQENTTLDVPPCLVIHEEDSDIWINVHDVFAFTNSTDPNLLSYIWASERTGYRHLYLNQYNLSECKEISCTPLTYGDWVVKQDQEVVYDSARNLVYFLANKETPLEAQLYSVSLSDSLITRLTENGHSTDQFYFDEENQYVVLTRSSLESTTNTSLYALAQENTNLKLQHINIIQHSSADPVFIPPETFCCKIDEGRHEMYGLIYKPHNHRPGEKHPTVLYIYAGPHVQLVANSSACIRNTRLHTLASIGYTVVVFDSRGSANRGLQWEGVLKESMGTVEIQDQVEGLKWLAHHKDYIDLSRVAIYGWSYGGYMSLMGLIQRPDIFKVAVSGAPVTYWEGYDTGYTERYMGKPADHPTAYQRGSILDQINKFPDQENRLLLIHGLMDENVFFNHTSKLMNSLIKSCKPFRVQVYPEERHGIRNTDSSRHFETSVLSFLQEALNS